MPFKAGFYYTWHEGGDKNQTPVILIHGAGSSHIFWPAEIRRLSGHNVIALDLPGHGRSSGTGCQSVGDYTAAILEFLADRGIFQAAFVGHSMGGAIALQLALDYPQHVVGIGVISAGANFNLPPELTAYLSSPATGTMGMRLLAQLLGFSDPALAMQEARFKLMNAVRLSVLYNDWLASSRFDLSARLSQINIPAFVACGSGDNLTPPAQSQYLADKLPIARLTIFHGGGHLLPLEQPHQLAAGLKRFLDDLLAWHAHYLLPAEFQQPAKNAHPNASNQDH
jgi:pimeloyl-ACP methyl ester carboxylesterase